MKSDSRNSTQGTRIGLANVLRMILGHRDRTWAHGEPRESTEALDYLACRGARPNRKKGNPAVILLDLKLPKLNGSYELGVNAYVGKPVSVTDFAGAVKDLGGLWALLNEPPPGSIRMQR